MTAAPARSRDPRDAPGAVPVLLLIVFLSLIGFGVVIPLLPFFATVFEAEAWQVTLLFATFSAGQFLGELFWGRLSDRIGRRPVLLITIFASALGYLALAFSPNIWIAIAARGAAGFFSGNMSTIQGYVVDVTPPERLAGRLGLIGSAFGVGFVVGPAIGGLLARPELGAAGFRPPLELAAGLCVLAGIGVLVFVRESRLGPRPPGIRRNPLAAITESLGHPVLATLLGCTFVSFAAFSAMWAVLGLWGEVRFGWGPRDIGLVMALTGVAAALSQGVLSGIFVRRIGPGVTIALGLSLTAICLMIQAISPWPWLVVVCMVLGVAGHASTQPAVTSLVSRSATPDRQGATLGASTAVGSLARVAGPIIAGVLFSSVGPSAPIVFSALGLIPAAWLGWRAARLLHVGRDP
ncbi:MFS transporter [Phenylobacterium sp.]|uniref:MFS transporter n=1 Tax=Phenylobacterium sp. TaxID=1871053 RepID=UPI003983D058